MNESRNPLELSLKLESQPCIYGLEDLRSYLERSCYSQVSIKECINDEQGCGLVVTLDCPLDLGDLLHHYTSGIWGNLTRTERLACCQSDWNYLFKFLQAENGFPLDIEELNLQLQDSLLTIQKTGPKSIIEGWATIFNLLSEHYSDFTLGGKQIPFEIYLTIQPESEPANKANDFSSYWALYLEGHTDCLIYDLQERQLLSDDVHLTGKGADI